MIKKTYISKSNTIVKGNQENYGLTPISSLKCGGTTSRFLIYFDIEDIKEYVKDNSSDFINEFTHTLHMFNSGSYDKNYFVGKNEDMFSDDTTKRNSSFDVIVFEVPQMWDGGVGHDGSNDFWAFGESRVSNHGSSWYNSTSVNKWENEGIYSTEKLSIELEKFNKNEESLIVNCQHFDFGNENIQIDITNFINDVIKGTKVNNGLCISLSPMNETVDTTEVNYTNFFNNNTNTFFKPYILSKSRKPIRDDRYNFVLGRENKLLLFVQIGGVLTNLDELPVCTINEVNYPVKQVKKGVYEASVKLNSGEHKKDEIIYDIWSNIKVNGELFDDVEMEFVTKSKDLHFRIGGVDDVSNKFTPVVQGVNDNEVIHFDEEREVKVYFKRNYTRDAYKIVENAQYRIYINDGKRELDVLEWDNINIYSDYNTFTIHANDFLPGKYFVDVKSQMDNEIKVFNKVLQFEIKDNIINEKH